jgi:serine/threonine protein kinase
MLALVTASYFLLASTLHWVYIVICSGLPHDNLIALKGFCLNPCCLALELVPEGNLHTFLHKNDGHPRTKGPDWPFMMLKIALDVARGLAFLHQHTGTRYPKILASSCSSPSYLVIHRDLKTPNILVRSLQ